MDDKVKIQIMLASVDALFKHGLPALANIVNTLNDKSDVTIEDIEAAKEMIDAEDYFK